MSDTAPPPAAYGFVPDGLQTGDGARPSDLLSLGLLLSYVAVAQLAGRFLLPKPKTAAARTARRLYMWHVFDACIHLVHEGLFLYHCFFVYGPVLPELATDIGPSGKSEPRLIGNHHWTAPGVHFLGRPDRVYGPHRGNSIFAHMWMDYAKADWRWAGTDLSIITVEMFMMLIIGPLGVWAADMLRRNGGTMSKKIAFWMVVCAAFETFGNWAVMIPEVITGFPNLNLHDGETFWIHLVFMNSIWIASPIAVLYSCYHTLMADPEDEKKRVQTTAAAIVGADSGSIKKA